MLPSVKSSPVVSLWITVKPWVITFDTTCWPRKFAMLPTPGTLAATSMIGFSM